MLALNLAAKGGCSLLRRPAAAARTTTLFLHMSPVGTRRQRSTLSSIWVPTGGISLTEGETGHGKLVRAGFVRQSHAGIFQLLPLGIKVQQKLNRLLDKHMQAIGASRVSLSSITSEGLWQKSGRLERVSSELFRFTDRKEVPLMLAPTHEEEVTSLVASTLQSYKDLPLRLYQITRKYRDEIRPRHGLLRSREFLMKDLYTFDVSASSAIETYQKVATAYTAFFCDLNLPIIVAEASSGDMGGDHSHEYHLAHEVGEDTVATCSDCGYAANDEIAVARSPPNHSHPTSTGDLGLSNFGVWRGVTKDRKTLVNAWYPRIDDGSEPGGLNLHAVKAVVPELDTSIRDCSEIWMKALQSTAGDGSDGPRLLNVVDSSLLPTFEELRTGLPLFPANMESPSLKQFSVTESPKGLGLHLRSLTDGAGCPRCESGTLQVHRALELGHTFYLGTRYTEPLEACVSLPQTPNISTPVHMGCYGIGISRILGAVAEHKADQTGLSWPRVIAPFEVALIPTSKVTQETLDFYDVLAGSGTSTSGFDIVLDDRKESFGWKIQDADMIGYPVCIILGKDWRSHGICEVQCKNLSLKEKVSAEAMPKYLERLLAKL